MIDLMNYKNACIAAILLHALLAFLLLFESTTDHPAMVAGALPKASVAESSVQEEAPAIQAVSVDQAEISKAVDRLKEARQEEVAAVQHKQQQLAAQAEAVRRQRVMEEQRINKLRAEAVKLAREREKHLLDEQQRLKQVALQKAADEKHLAEMKQQQEQLKKLQIEDMKKLADARAKKALDAARAVTAVKADQAKQLAKQVAAQEAAAQQAAVAAENSARVAGEVDKYKALIIGAISRQWILPEHANSTMSSQFRIRLAPNGLVLEVSLTRSSGDPILDRSAQSAIYKASPLPVPSDPDAFNVFRDISLTVRPENARG